MTAYQHQDIILQRAGEYLEKLRVAGIETELDIESLREFSVKLRVFLAGRDAGRLTIHYKPTAHAFTLGTVEVKNKTLIPRLEKCWAGLPAEAKAGKDISAAGGIDIYVDGSFLNEKTGYAAIILKDGKVIKELSGSVSDPGLQETRQVAGEIKAVEEAINWCQENGAREVSIYYDYQGLEKWVSGRYKSNIALTRNYRDLVRSSGLDIRWHKVKSHTGNRWNERADALAKQGAGILPAGESVPRPAEPNMDLLRPLSEKAEKFTVFLRAKGLDAVFLKIFNGQFARIRINSGAGRPGFFDLYNTVKKRFSPYLHDFGGEAIRKQVEVLWQEFSKQEQNDG